MAIYDTFTIGTPLNKIHFNDENNDPYFRVIRRYPTRRDIDDFDIKLPEGSGIADWQTYIGRMYFILEGKMYPNSESAFHSGRETIRKLASLTVEQADSQSDSGYVPITWSENIPKTMYAKVLYVDMQESTRNGIIQPFRLLCKVKYPVVLASVPSAGSITIGNYSGALGGAIIPATIPMQIGTAPTGVALPFTLPAVLGGTAGTGTITLTNAGDLPAYPTITITGPINKPKLSNITTGEYIELDVNLASTGASAQISYDADSINVVANNTNVYGKLTSGSTLFKVKSGANSFVLTGSSVGTGANATVTFNSTYSLS